MNELEILAAWIVGEDIPADRLEEALFAHRTNVQLDEDADEKLSMALRGRAVAYRRRHGKWPEYRSLPA